MAVTSVKVASFEINEEKVPSTGANFQISFDLQHQINLDQKQYGLLLTVNYWSGEQSNSALKIQVQNGFSISNLEEFVKKEGNDMQVNMPQQLMGMLLDISMHHSRALIADYTTNTKLETSYLPLINPLEMLQQMQPLQA
ncbi:MAG: hypothetical protein EOP53_22510 [Sphingobacteriales bacterium]|nr:MAG: hypothetical protein EOP53_22510 [Sphingobacteriales bacterium]